MESFQSPAVKERWVLAVRKKERIGVTRLTLKVWCWLCVKNSGEVLLTCLKVWCWLCVRKSEEVLLT